MEKIDTTKLAQTVEKLLHAAIFLRAAITKAREEMPVSYVAHEINLAEHRLDDAVASLRTARKWAEDDYMTGNKTLEELLVEVGVTVAKNEMALGKA